MNAGRKPEPGCALSSLSSMQPILFYMKRSGRSPAFVEEQPALNDNDDVSARRLPRRSRPRYFRASALATPPSGFHPEPGISFALGISQSTMTARCRGPVDSGCECRRQPTEMKRSGGGSPPAIRNVPVHTRLPSSVMPTKRSVPAVLFRTSPDGLVRAQRRQQRARSPRRSSKRCPCLICQICSRECRDQAELERARQAASLSRPSARRRAGRL